MPTVTPLPGAFDSEGEVWNPELSEGAEAGEALNPVWSEVANPEDSEVLRETDEVLKAPCTAP